MSSQFLTSSGSVEINPTQAGPESSKVRVFKWESGPSRTQVRLGQLAFTLIELLLVLVILGILAALVVPRFTNRSQQARLTAAKADISAISTALNAFEIDTGRYPTSEEGLGALIQSPASAEAWHGPYLERGLPKDPWGNAYVYHCPGDHNADGFDLVSLGPDGRDGNDDIGNWNP